MYSAGTEPKGLARTTVAVMAEIGIDVRGQRSKSVEEVAGQLFDHVITVCASARENCPVFPGGGKRTHWSVADPAEARARGQPTLEVFREARDDLRRRIEELLRQDSPGSG